MLVVRAFLVRLRRLSHSLVTMPKLTELPLQAVAKIQQYAERGSAELHYALKMFEAGAFKIEPPQNVADEKEAHQRSPREMSSASVMKPSR